MHIHIYIHMCMYVCMYVCIYIYVSGGVPARVREDAGRRAEVLGGAETYRLY